MGQTSLNSINRVTVTDITLVNGLGLGRGWVGVGSYIIRVEVRLGSYIIRVAVGLGSYIIRVEVGLSREEKSGRNWS
jgi:hypothetical protein